MAAGLGFKTFTTGEVLSAGDTNGYLMQGVLVFASAAARDAAITSPQEGQFAYLKDTNVTTYYTGSAWTALVSGDTLVGVGLTKSADQSLTNATYTAITFDGESWDTDTYHDNATNNSRITIPAGKAGKYLVTVNLSYAASGVGSIRLVNIYKNGATTGDNNFPTNPTFNSCAVRSVVMDLAVSDYIQAFAYQDSGGALNLKATSLGTVFQATYLGA
jgi:hypothetical protein